MVLNIAIIGAGIIGITTASRIKEQIPDVKLTIIAQDFSPNTTSDVSAGYWEPYCINESKDEIEMILKWGKETYDKMLSLAISRDGGRCGVQALSAYVLQDSDTLNIPFWAKLVSQFRVIDKEEIKLICNVDENSNFKHGYHFLTTTVTVLKYLSVLQEDLTKTGTRFIQKKLANIDDFQTEDFDYLINCSGLGSRKLFNDSDICPVRGQVIRLKAPWIKYCLMIDGKNDSNEVTYVLPLTDLVVIGGTKEMNNYNSESNESDCSKILERSFKYLPSLMNAEIVSKQAGLRPYRNKGIRLELEVYKKNEKTMKVIHNYGHGGSGITLCWGCASSVVEIVKNDLNKN